MPVNGSNARIYIGSFNLSPFTNNASVTGNADALDVSVYGDTSREYIKGLNAHSLTFSGFIDAASATGNMGTLNTLFSASSVTAWSFYPNGDSVGSPVYTGQIWGGQLELGAPVDGVQTWAVNGVASAQFAQTQGFGYGLSLHELKAETGTGSYADTDNTVSTANGYIAVLHCTAFASGTTTVKIQHGATTGTYADLGTQFSNLTAAGSQVIFGSGTVNRYVRAQVSAISASTTFAVTFVRK